MERMRRHPGIVVFIFIVILGLIITGVSLSIKTAIVNQNTAVIKNSSFGDNTTLPYSNPLYSISAPVNNVITINADAGYRNAAVNELYTFGLDPTNYKIVFTYESPFKAYE